VYTSSKLNCVIFSYPPLPPPESGPPSSSPPPTHCDRAECKFQFIPAGRARSSACDRKKNESMIKIKTEMETTRLDRDDIAVHL